MKFFFTLFLHKILCFSFVKANQALFLFGLFFSLKTIKDFTLSNYLLVLFSLDHQVCFLNVSSCMLPPSMKVHKVSNKLLSYFSFSFLDFSTCCYEVIFSHVSNNFYGFQRISFFLYFFLLATDVKKRAKQIKKEYFT